jgi:hypothetical protein
MGKGRRAGGLSGRVIGVEVPKPGWLIDGTLRQPPLMACLALLLASGRRDDEVLLA